MYLFKTAMEGGICDVCVHVRAGTRISVYRKKPHKDIRYPALSLTALVLCDKGKLTDNIPASSLPLQGTGV